MIEIIVQMSHYRSLVVVLIQIRLIHPAFPAGLCAATGSGFDGCNGSVSEGPRAGQQTGRNTSDNLAEQLAPVVLDGREFTLFTVLDSRLRGNDG